MELTNVVVFGIIVVLLVVIIVIAASTMSPCRYVPIHQDNQKIANEIALSNYERVGARTRDALATAQSQWTTRTFLHRGLIDAALSQNTPAIVAALERLDAQADTFGEVYVECSKEFPCDAFTQGLKSMDRSFLDIAQNYTVGDIPSYNAAVTSASSTHTLLGTDAASLNALSDYQAAMVAYMRAVARGALSMSYIELDKAVVASQAVGNALLNPILV